MASISRLLRRAPDLSSRKHWLRLFSALDIVYQQISSLWSKRSKTLFPMAKVQASRNVTLTFGLLAEQPALQVASEATCPNTSHYHWLWNRKKLGEDQKTCWSEVDEVVCVVWQKGVEEVCHSGGEVTFWSFPARCVEKWFISLGFKWRVQMQKP